MRTNRVDELINKIEKGLKYKDEVTEVVYDYGREDGLTVEEIHYLLIKLEADGYDGELIDIYADCIVCKTVVRVRQKDEINNTLNAESVRLGIQYHTLNKAQELIDKDIEEAKENQNNNDIDINLESLDKYKLSDSSIILLKEIYKNKGYQLDITTDEGRVYIATIKL